VYEKGTLVGIKDSTQMKAATAGAEKTIEKVETESDFQGGQAGWLQHLQKNLRYPAEAIDKELQGQVIVQFIISKNGEVEQPAIFRSVNMYLDKEALRMITISPRWEPAVQNGTNVKSYKRQPITFRLTRSR
jgi:protein TonB